MDRYKLYLHLQFFFQNEEEQRRRRHERKLKEGKIAEEVNFIIKIMALFINY